MLRRDEFLIATTYISHQENPLGMTNDVNGRYHVEQNKENYSHCISKVQISRKFMQTWTLNFEDGLSQNDRKPEITYQT